MEDKLGLGLFVAGAAALATATYLNSQTIQASKRKAAEEKRALEESKQKAIDDRVAHCTSAEASYKRIYRCPHITEWVAQPIEPLVSPLLGSGTSRSLRGGDGFILPNHFVPADEFATQSTIFHESDEDQDLMAVRGFHRAGPRMSIFFNPSEVRAAIVTCGGLCPGLNTVIREIVMTLHYLYNVKETYGITFGYKGFYAYDFRKLTPSDVSDIHMIGGTVLGSSRGGFDLDKMINSLIEKGINQLYVIGGDGTHRGAYRLHEEVVRRGLKIAVIGIPKTIDNDIPIIDKSFGFESAVEEAQRAIVSANVEAKGAENGVGLVKLMGRSCGFIAMHAALADRDVNVCLIPEVPFELYGENGLLEFVRKRMLTRGHCVIVCAEGAAEAVIDDKLIQSGTDASGNPKLADIGKFIKEKLEEHAKKHNMEMTIKYIDPTYMVRSIGANATDRLYCSTLAQNAVHAAFAGYGGVTVGVVNGRHVYIPITELMSRGVNRVSPNSRMWQRVLASTGQPAFLSPDAFERIQHAQDHKH